VIGVGGDRVTRRFLTDFRYLSQSEEQLDGSWQREIVQDLLEAAVGGLPTEGAVRLGFDDDHMSVKQHAKLQRLASQNVELVAAGGVVEDLRMVKDAEEIARIRAAALLADAALEAVLGRGLAGRTEEEVAFDLETEMRRMGAQGPSFPSIVASGAHGALPHAVPRDVEIPDGVLVTIDWGAQLDGYASDCTRTYATGQISDGDRDIYELVQRAQAAALAAVRPGPTGKEVDAVAREIISEGGYGDRFGHGLGHGVGMEVHEGPRLAMTSEDELFEGNVVTVEPGIYLPGKLGVRIEDLVVVTKDGYRNLSGLSKELQVVG
jgi:Xaa-Pro aminopeptidase